MFGKIVYIDKPLLAVPSAENDKRLATNSSNKLMPKTMRLFAIVRAQPNTLIIDEHDIHNTVLFDRAKLAPGNELSVNDSQRLPAENDPPTDPDVDKRNTQALATEYAVDRIESYKRSRDDHRYQVRWYGYLPEHGTLEFAQDLLQLFIHLCSKKKPHRDKRQRKWNIANNH